MDLKMRQTLVQTCGTITAFNYAYCKTIYDQAFWLLESDIIDANREPFALYGVVTGQWVAIYQQRWETTQQAKDNYDHDLDFEQTQANGVSDYRKTINASHIIIKEGSLLPVLVEHLSEQTKIKDIIRFPSSGGCCSLEEVRRLSNEINLFFDQVGQFLAMFEQS